MQVWDQIGGTTGYIACSSSYTFMCVYVFVVLNWGRSQRWGIVQIMSSWVYGYLGWNGMHIAQLIRVNSTDAGSYTLAPGAGGDMERVSRVS